MTDRIRFPKPTILNSARYGSMNVYYQDEVDEWRQKVKDFIKEELKDSECVHDCRYDNCKNHPLKKILGMLET